MSTKSTIAMGKGWSLYEEMLDDTVWISTEGSMFIAEHNRVRVQIPHELIDSIREAGERHFPHLRGRNNTTANLTHEAHQEDI